MTSLRTAILVAALVATGPFAHADVCLKEPEVVGRTVGEVSVGLRWLDNDAKSRLLDGIAGEPYSGAKLATLQGRIRDLLSEEENAQMEQVLHLLKLSGSTTFLSVSCFEDAGPDKVNLRLSAFYLRVDVLDLGSNLLPVPRSAAPSVLQTIPKPLVAFKPIVSFSKDVRYGTSFSGSTETDVLNLRRPDAQGRSLRVRLKGNKAFDEDFYGGAGSVEFNGNREGKSIHDWSFAGSYSQEFTPQGDATVLRRYVSAEPAMRFSTRLRILQEVKIGAGYVRSDDYSPTSGLRDIGEGLQVETATEGQVLGGLLRTAFRYEGVPDSSAGNTYSKFTGGAWFYTEVGRANHTFGIDIVTSIGSISGNAAPISSFFGGSWREGPESRFNLTSPATAITGPLLRHLGREGSTAMSDFWGVSANLAIPLPKLSRKLIPDDLTGDSDNLIPLSDRLQRVSINTAEAGIEDSLITEYAKPLIDAGVPEEEAEEKVSQRAHEDAVRIVQRDFARPIDFISHRANLYAVRALVMLDLARSRDIGAGTQFRSGVGGGIQFLVLIAHFDVGYIFNTHRIGAERTGNLVARISFSNFF